MKNNVSISENKHQWLVLLNRKIAAKFDKKLYTESAARTYGAGLSVELGLS